MFEINYLKLGQKGVINYDIPVYSIGEGKKTFTITCSVHGDETAGLFIVNDFLNKIKGETLKGKINIIPAANPVAQFLYSRTSFLDQKDLNRAGKGRFDGSYTDRLANILFKFLKQSDIVVNIHEFEMISPVMGIFDVFDNKETENKILETINIFQPDMIWQINYNKQSDIQYLTTLDLALSKEGVINFPFETSQIHLITQKDINKASDGLLNIACSLGILNKKINNKKNEIPVFIRKEFSSDLSGLWIPEQNLELLKPIKNNQLIGKIVSLPDFIETEIYSEHDGILLQYRSKQMISNGTSIYSIG
ncbi:MAG: succinylglutamate desuccinylase/aspartoacylase family protein [Candidatus Sericytochromatia bacterium]